MGQGSGFLLYRVLDCAIDSYFPVLNTILSVMEGIEDTVFNDEIEDGKDISILRRDIITRRRVMFPTRALFVELKKRLNRFTKTNPAPYFSDLIDYINKITDPLNEFAKWNIMTVKLVWGFVDEGANRFINNCFAGTNNTGRRLCSAACRVEQSFRDNLAFSDSIS